MKRDRAPNLRAIADASGYSTATVSWALRGHPRVPETTRSKIRAVADQLGYRADPKLAELQAHLRRGKPRSSGEVLALVTPYPSKTRWKSEIVTGIRERAAEFGYEVEEFPLDEERGGYSEQRLNSVFSARSIRGVIVHALDIPRPLEDLSWAKYSAVTVSYSLQSPRLHRVGNNHYQSMALALLSLRKKGYRRIGLVLDESQDERVNHLWQASYFVNTKASGASSIPALIAHPVTEEAFRDWFWKHKPEVVLVEGLRYTNAFEWLRRMDLKIPEDVGYANLYLFPPYGEIGGINQESHQQGRAMVDLAVAQILSNERGIPSHPKTVLIDGSWVDGKTIRSLAEEKD